MKGRLRGAYNLASQYKFWTTNSLLTELKIAFAGSESRGIYGLTLSYKQQKLKVLYNHKLVL